MTKLPDSVTLTILYKFNSHHSILNNITKSLHTEILNHTLIAFLSANISLTLNRIPLSLHQSPLIYSTLACIQTTSSKKGKKRKQASSSEKGDTLTWTRRKRVLNFIHQRQFRRATGDTSFGKLSTTYPLICFQKNTAMYIRGKGTKALHFFISFLIHFHIFLVNSFNAFF